MPLPDLRPFAAGFCLAFLLPIAAPAAARAQTTALYMDSEPGDIVGAGVERTVTPADGTFTVYRNYRNGITVTYLGPSYDTRVELSFAAAHEALMTARTYENADWHSFRREGLQVSTARYCNSVDGRFDVLEVAYDANGEVTRFAADFEQHCQGADAALFGAIRYNSTNANLRPFGGAYPSYRIAIAPSEFGQVTGPGLLCGAGSQSCEHSFAQPTSIVLTATPSDGYVFMGWTGACTGDHTADLHVNGPKNCAARFEPAGADILRTRLLLHSEAGDPLGLGVKRIYAPHNSGWTFWPDSQGRELRLVIEGDDGENYRIDLGAPGNAMLLPGEYHAARDRTASDVFPMISVSVNSRSCSTVQGRFTIYELAYNPDGSVQRLAADFEHRCDDSPHALFGAIRYRSSLEELRPFGGSFPTHSLTIDRPSHGTVTADGVDCGPSGTACSIVVAQGTTVRLVATPEPGYFLLGWTGDCAGGAETSVVVTGAKHCSAHFEPTLVDGERTLLWMQSTAGDVVGNGRQYSYTPSTAYWSVSRSWWDSGVEFVVQTMDGTWSIALGPPGGMSLMSGSYPDAARGFRGRPVLNVSRRNPGPGSCTAVTGRFVVHELEFAGLDVVRFAADFEQHCQGADPALFGAIRYNSTIPDYRPFEGVYPTYQLSIVESALGRVTGDGIDCGDGGTACLATYSGPGSVTLTATPSGTNVFLGWAGSCLGLETITVRVNGPKECEALFVPSTEPKTLLLLDSRPGDYVGGGARYLYSPVNTAWSVDFDGNRVRFGVEAVDGSWWYATFGAPMGGAMEKRLYVNAQRWPFNLAAPGLDVYGNGRGCNELWGRFEVHEIVRDQYGALLSFAADFEQHCEDSDAALFGAVRYNSAAPVQPFGSYPAYELHLSPPAHGRVTGQSVDCGSGRTACHVSFSAPASLVLTATPDHGYQFGGWVGECRGGPVATVRVHGPKACTAAFLPITGTARTLVVLDSTPGEYIGQGQHHIYSTANAFITAVETDDRNGVIFDLTGTDGSDWRMSFGAPLGQTLAVGTYAGAVSRWDRTTTAGLEISGNHRGCGSITGGFIVREIVFGAAGVVERAAIDFEQRCPSATSPALTGSIRYRSSAAAALPGRSRAPIVLGQAARASNGGWIQRLFARDGAYAPAPTLRLPWPVYNAVSGEVHPAAGDVDGDGRDEIVLGLGSGSDGWIAVLDDEKAGYALLKWLQVTWSTYNRTNGAVYPAVGDLDGDGEAEIVAGLGAGSNGYLEVFGSARTGYAHRDWLRVSYGTWAAQNGETHPAIGDLDGNGAGEIVVGLGNGGGGWLEVFHDARQQHRHMQWLQVGWSLFATRSGATWPAIGDIDGDTVADVVVGLGAGGDGWLQVFASAAGSVRHRDWLRLDWADYNARCGETRPAIGALGSFEPGVVVGLGSCGIGGGWVALMETAAPKRPIIWRNHADPAFRTSGGGLFPALVRP